MFLLLKMADVPRCKSVKRKHRSGTFAWSKVWKLKLTDLKWLWHILVILRSYIHIHWSPCEMQLAVCLDFILCSVYILCTSENLVRWMTWETCNIFINWLDFERSALILSLHSNKEKEMYKNIPMYFVVMVKVLLILFVGSISSYKPVYIGSLTHYWLTKINHNAMLYYLYPKLHVSFFSICCIMRVSRRLLCTPGECLHNK